MQIADKAKDSTLRDLAATAAVEAREQVCPKTNGTGSAAAAVAGRMTGWLATTEKPPPEITHLKFETATTSIIKTKYEMTDRQDCRSMDR